MSSRECKDSTQCETARLSAIHDQRIKARQRKPIVNTFLRKVSGGLARSRVLRNGRHLFELNGRDWALPMSKFQKLQAGIYIILNDYSRGKFPPRFDDKLAAYEGEINYYQSLAGVSVDEAKERNLRKPFWGPAEFQSYARCFAELLRVLRKLGLYPQSQLLELGCGTGWMAEFLVYSGYSVVGTSLAPVTIEIAKRREEALRVKGFSGQARFQVGPMENVDEFVEHDFDGVFVFESLHHAFSWRRAIGAAYRCLKPGGWLLLANEPNVLHTFISYREGRLTNTHEIGLSRKQVTKHMVECGFTEIIVLAPKFNNFLSPHWIAARK
jgi:ubiquinone/menaquinone biosynthesis C-methylase UbiE